MFDYKTVLINIIFVSIFMFFYFFNFITLYVSSVIFKKQIELIVDNLFNDFKNLITPEIKDSLITYIDQYMISSAIDKSYITDEVLDKKYNQQKNNLFTVVNIIFYLSLFYVSFVLINLWYFKSINTKDEIITALYNACLILIFETIFIIVITLNYMTINPNKIKKILYSKLINIFTQTNM